MGDELYSKLGGSLLVQMDLYCDKPFDIETTVLHQDQRKRLGCLDLKN